MTPQQIKDSQEVYSDQEQDHEDLQEFEESRISNKLSEKIGRKSSFISEAKNSKHSPLSSIKHHSIYTLKDNFEKYSPLRGEEDLASLTMEKIANLKELSKEMFVMNENELQWTNSNNNPKSNFINVEDNLHTKESEFSTFRSELDTFGPGDDGLSSAKALQPLPSIINVYYYNNNHS